jgi:hypothetical protein
MPPIIEVSEEVMNALNPNAYSRRHDLETKHDGFIYVPSIGLHVAKERTLLGENWFNSHRLLQEQGNRMLTTSEFVEFLNHLKSNPSDYQVLFDDITQVRTPWRAEWLDGDFKVVGKKLCINSSHEYSNGKLNPRCSEIMDKNTLMEDKTPGISLESWLKTPTRQGLPSKKTESGELYYLFPRSDNNSVVGFDAFSGGAGLSCCRSPSYSDSDLGVRAAKQR